MEKNQVSSIIIEASQSVICAGIFPEAKRLTPTGKISHARTRVYTQRYRKEWEEMPDFKGWLTSVPNQVTRAFCTYCKKNLHAHRLSLLKHTCTMKHQRSALMHQTRLQIKTDDDNENDDDDEERMIDYDESFAADDSTIKKHDIDDNNDDDDNDNQLSYVENLDMEDEECCKLQERLDQDEQSKIESNEESPNKKIKLSPSSRRDPIAQAMAHVHDEYFDNEDQNALEMPSESEVNDKGVKEFHFEACNDNKVEIAHDEKDVDSNAGNTLTITPLKNKTIVLSSGKTVTLTTGKLPPGYILSKVKGNLPTFIVGGSKSANLRQIVPKAPAIPAQSSPGPSNQTKRAVESLKNVPNKYSSISTHVMDTSKGLPIGGLQVSLYKLMDGRWTFVNESTTTPNGRCNDLVDLTKSQFTAGRYKLHFDVDKYFSLRRVETMFPFIEVVFDVKNPTGSHHIPMLLSPFGYTTYRGIDRMEQPHISTHVLDTSRGVAVSDLRVSLYKKVDDIWTIISESKTTARGRCADFLSIAGETLSVGSYKLVFHVEEYFSTNQVTSLYPTVEIVFNINNSGEHYHLPLLLTPFGFGTYRGTA